MRRFALTAVALAAIAVAGCSSSSSSSPASTPASSSSSAASSSSATQTGTITVFAAASLMGTFTQLGKQFEAAHPGDTVKFSFGGSSTLATQITGGAPILDIMNQMPQIPPGCQWAVFLRNHDELTLEMVTNEERDYMYAEYAKDVRMRINLDLRRRSPR